MALYLIHAAFVGFSSVLWLKRLVLVFNFLKIFSFSLAFGAYFLLPFRKYQNILLAVPIFFSVLYSSQFGLWFPTYLPTQNVGKEVLLLIFIVGYYIVNLKAS